MEGFFSILKRGLIGTYHHVGSPHLHRYANEFDSLVERGGKVRSFHVADVTGQNLKAVLLKQVHAETHVMTDASPRYNVVKREQPFAGYDQVNHQNGESSRSRRAGR